MSKLKLKAKGPKVKVRLRYETQSKNEQGGIVIVTSYPEITYSGEALEGKQNQSNIFWVKKAQSDFEKEYGIKATAATYKTVTRTNK